MSTTPRGLQGFSNYAAEITAMTEATGSMFARIAEQARVSEMFATRIAEQVKVSDSMIAALGEVRVSDSMIAAAAEQAKVSEMFATRIAEQVRVSDMVAGFLATKAIVPEARASATPVKTCARCMEEFHFSFEKDALGTCSRSCTARLLGFEYGGEE